MANSVVRRLFPPRLGGLGLVGATPSGVAVRLLTSTGWLGWCGPQHSSACSVAQFSSFAHTPEGEARESRHLIQVHHLLANTFTSRARFGRGHRGFAASSTKRDDDDEEEEEEEGGFAEDDDDPERADYEVEHDGIDADEVQDEDLGAPARETVEYHIRTTNPPGEVPFQSDLVNCVHITGRVSSEIDLVEAQGPNGNVVQVATFSVDVDIKDNGEEKIQTIDVEMHGEEAVRAREYVTTNAEVYLRGQILDGGENDDPVIIFRADELKFVSRSMPQPVSQPVPQSTNVEHRGPAISPQPISSGDGKLRFRSENEKHEWIIQNYDDLWDNRLTKRNPRAPDFKHKRTKDVIWLSMQVPSEVTKRLNELYGVQEAAKKVIFDELIKDCQGPSLQNFFDNRPDKADGNIGGNYPDFTHIDFQREDAAIWLWSAPENVKEAVAEMDQRNRQNNSGDGGSNLPF